MEWHWLVLEDWNVAGKRQLREEEKRKRDKKRKIQTDGTAKESGRNRFVCTVNGCFLDFFGLFVFAAHC